MNVCVNVVPQSSHSSHPSPGDHLGGSHPQPAGGEINLHWHQLDHSGGGRGKGKGEVTQAWIHIWHQFSPFINRGFRIRTGILERTISLMENNQEFPRDSSFFLKFHSIFQINNQGKSPLVLITLEHLSELAVVSLSIKMEQGFKLRTSRGHNLGLEFNYFIFKIAYSKIFLFGA